MQNTTFIRTLAVITMVLMPLGAFAEQLTGTSSYRERIALPPEATFRAILFDISNNGQVEIGRFETSGDAGPPYNFSIDYSDEDVVEGGLYSITTEVIWPDRAYVAAGTILQGFPAALPGLDLIMVRPGLSPASTDRGALQPEVQMIGAHGLALPASFEGVVEGNAGEETWRLYLSADQTFQLSRAFDDTKRDGLGRWVADPTLGTLVLRDGAEMPLVIQPVPASGALRVLDANTGETLDGNLSEVEATAVDLANMTLGGTMTYFADSAVFEHCVSGATFPLAQEEEYLALEQAYLDERIAPGAPLYVLLEGGLAMRPAMEGPDRQMVIVDRFIRTRSELSCAQQRADAVLQNTYWRLDTLQGEAFPMEAVEREPHLVLEVSDDAA